MKRIVLMVTVAWVMVLMLAVAGPAFATIHPLSNAECADASASEVSKGLQDPPGLTPGALPPDAVGADLAQPVISASGGDPFSPTQPSPAFKTFGTSVAALDAFYCPANK